MIILGVNNSHLATACILKDGKIIACISEERLTRIKNQSGFPYKAIKECLRITGLKINEIDFLAIGFIDPLVNTGFSVYPGANEGNLNLSSMVWLAKEWMLANLPPSRYLYEQLAPLFYKFFINPSLDERWYAEIAKKTGIEKPKIIKVEHHTAHAYAALFSDPNYDNGPKLVLTLDAMGDNLCSTVSIYKDGVFKRVAKTKAGNSLGDLYAYVTSYLGLKRGEHEYKVMGLAPYANKEQFAHIYKKLKKLIWVNDDLTFGSKVYSHVFYRVLDKILLHERFDNVSGAVQQLTEDLLKDWVTKAISKTGVNNLVCGGGVFMNVKANQLIAELPQVKSFFVMPSGGDESTAMGAAYWAYLDKKADTDPKISGLRDLYLGTEFNEVDINKSLKSSRYKDLRVSKPKDIEKTVARLLADNNIVARVAGKMEWGARALGNRSILANPSNLNLVKEINEQIKSRDFWMPFAPAILEERLDKYTVNKKHLSVPYMMITFDTTELGKRDLVSAMHPYDHTVRPQAIMKDWNPGYYKIVSEFEKITGIGAVLNTSYNLHGFPIVWSPEDALDVLMKSGLKYLAIGPFIVSKV